MMRFAPALRSVSSSGFTLVEMIIVVFLLALAMLGILSVFDASARINKSESDVADAQGAVRYGIYSMTKAIRMAGAGGLYVTQAVLNHRDPQLPGITVVNGVHANSYDNVEDGTVVTSLNGDIPVRPGTDMIEIRGVINSPLVGFDLKSGCAPCNPSSNNSSGCQPCVGARAVEVATTSQLEKYAHVNDDPSNRPQFSQIDDYTAGVTGTNRMYVLVAFNVDKHDLCETPGFPPHPLYPQNAYNVGAISAPTQLVSGTPPTFGNVNFADARAIEFNCLPGGTEDPADIGRPAQDEAGVRHAGILDDLIFFIDNGTDPLHAHPSLAQGIRRGDAFDVVTLADDVEDMQIAYGVDIDGNGEINRTAPPSPSDPDTNVSSAAGGDEWVPNVPGNDNPITTSALPLVATDFYNLNKCPRLHAVMITLVAKSHDPDLTYKAPAALGVRTMNSPVTIAPPHPDTAQYPGLPNASFRRRVQTLKINLRNYSFQGSASPAPTPTP